MVLLGPPPQLSVPLASRVALFPLETGATTTSALATKCASSPRSTGSAARPPVPATVLPTSSAERPSGLTPLPPGRALRLRPQCRQQPWRTRSPRLLPSPAHHRTQGCRRPRPSGPRSRSPSLRPPGPSRSHRRRPPASRIRSTVSMSANSPSGICFALSHSGAPPPPGSCQWIEG